MPLDFNRLVIFGDSLSDPGNLPEPARPDAPYVNGRYSNGPIYADILPRALGVPSLDLALGGGLGNDVLTTAQGRGASRAAPAPTCSSSTRTAPRRDGRW
jgi:hypothetical protein